jgi:hypothetical protein
VRRAAKPEDREKFVNADQIYDLAEELSDFSEAFAAYAMRLGRFLQEANAG